MNKDLKTRSTDKDDAQNTIRRAVAFMEFDPENDPVLDFYTRHGHGD